MPLDNPAVAVEQQYGWLIPPTWAFVAGVEYDHESAVTIIRWTGQRHTRRSQRESHEEMMIHILQDYIQQFRCLNRSPRGNNRYAPHKPFLLLAVIELIKRGEIEENRIPFSDSLITLFKKYISLTPGWNPTIYNPFFRLQNNGFWHLYPIALRDSRPSSNLQLQRAGAYAQLDDDLFTILKVPEYQEIFRQIIIDRYFPDLREKIDDLTIEAEAAEYSESLIQGIEHPFSAYRDIASIQVETPVRSAGFRRAIMEIYEHTCAVCELNIRASTGESVTDAAHIIPFSVSYNDDIRNGISLCKSHHWAFDTGLISVNEAYEVIVSRSMTEQGPIASMLTELRNKPIWLPNEPEHRPAQDALTWHRKKVMQQ